MSDHHISGVELHLYPGFIRALAMVKLAAARANRELMIARHTGLQLGLALKAS